MLYVVSSFLPVIFALSPCIYPSLFSSTCIAILSSLNINSQARTRTLRDGVRTLAACVLNCVVIAVFHNYIFDYFHYEIHKNLDDFEKFPKIAIIKPKTANKYYIILKDFVDFRLSNNYNKVV